MAHPLPIGSTIGMLGGGQLGRMFALAAAPLGYRVHVYSHLADGPCAQVTNLETVAGYDDEAALEAFCAAVDVVTYEWENIPAATVAFCEERLAVRPSTSLLQTCQDRLLEKQAVRDAGVGTAPFAAVSSDDELAAAIARIGTPCVIKSARGGYDGKGQVTIDRPADAAQAWADINRVDAIVEGFVDFQCELSVVIARSPSGQIAVYDPVENVHVEHILDTTYAPARVDAAVCERAVQIGRRLADAFDLEGLFAVELFLRRDGELLVNEIAPRPHNSGHWTIDACHTSQFEQAVRAVCDLPLGSPARHSDAIMQNLIGPLDDRPLQTIADPRANLHLYGKRKAYPGRKMGHVTRLAPLSELRVAHLSEAP